MWEFRGYSSLYRACLGPSGDLGSSLNCCLKYLTSRMSLLWLFCLSVFISSSLSVSSECARMWRSATGMKMTMTQWQPEPTALPTAHSNVQTWSHACTHRHGLFFWYGCHFLSFKTSDSRREGDRLKEKCWHVGRDHDGQEKNKRLIGEQMSREGRQ